MKSKLIFIFIAIAFIVFMILIITSLNNDKEKLINVLENYSFECTDSNCTKIAKENYCELTGSIDFFKY